MKVTGIKGRRTKGDSPLRCPIGPSTPPPPPSRFSGPPIPVGPHSQRDEVVTPCRLPHGPSGSVSISYVVSPRDNMHL